MFSRLILLIDLNLSQLECQRKKKKIGVCLEKN